MLPRGEHVRSSYTLGVWVALLIDGLGFENFVVLVDICKSYDLRV
jgi:hypothetical protein